MNRRRVYIETYGCQMNVADTELILGHLVEHGYEHASSPDRADVILLNTCSIREHAEERVLGRIAALAHHKARRPGVKLGLTGCLVQHLRERLLERAPYLDVLAGPDAYRNLPDLLEREPPDLLVDLRLDRTETYAGIAPKRTGGVRAWVTAMRGCDRFCTFCVVPFVRGRERSVPGPTLIQQVRRLAGEGHREVIYLGQTVNAYHDGSWDFAELLKRTTAIDGIARIRFTSPHPAEMTDRLIEIMATTSRVSPYLHLPVQSGSDRILRRMARDYDTASYVALVDRLRSAIPDLALSTDIMVGFPEEEELDFASTLDLVTELRFDHAFMFKYSRRKGTKAYSRGETVSDEEKTSRLQRLIALQERIAAEKNLELIGRSVEVLVEGPAKRPPGWQIGRTPQFKVTVFPDVARVGDVIGVQIAGATAHTLVAAAASGDDECAPVPANGARTRC
jgi:tRNA-2-methylthio-N6-dimethylallyladenosine synthase